MALKKMTTMPGKDDQTGTSKQQISETLVDFSQPLLKLLDRGMPPDTFKEAFKIAVTIWNGAVLDHLNNTSQYINELKSTFQNTGMPPMETLVNDLIETKQTQYAHDLRLIVDYQVSLDPSGELKVEAKARVMPSVVK